MSPSIEQLAVVSVTPFSLLDYPGLSSCILWFTGCNFRCPYCHNPDFALNRGEPIKWASLEAFLQSRRQSLDGVVLSGGECTLSPMLGELCSYLKRMGFLVKLDTNGSNPKRLSALLYEGLIDYVALDFKAPLENYQRAVGWGRTALWEESFELIQADGLPFELRITAHPDLLSESDTQRMLDWAASRGYAGPIYVQHCDTDRPTLGKLKASATRFKPTLLQAPPGMEIKLRNFTAYETRAFEAYIAGETPDAI